MLDFSARNLQLSNENAELSSRLSTDQRAVQTLTDRLAQVCQENDEAAASYKQLEETLQQQKRDTLKLQEQWLKEKELLERELKTAKEMVWICFVGHFNKLFQSWQESLKLLFFFSSSI